MNANRKNKAYLLTIFDTTLEIFSTWVQGAQPHRATYQSEMCPSTGKIHIQAFVEFPERISLNQLKKIPVLATAHIEAAKYPRSAQEYCKKEETRVDGPYQLGPEYLITKPKLNVIRDLIKKADIDTIKENHFGIYIRSRRAILDEIALNQPFTTKEGVRGIWIHGYTGVGKTYTVRTINQPMYIKPPNKWWDGYTNEQLVLADDWDHTQSTWVSHYLKIWGDRYSFSAETKGGTIRPNYNYFIITSNFTIDEFTTGYNQCTTNAIKRRFKEFNFNNKQAIEDFLSFIKPKEVGSAV